MTFNHSEPSETAGPRSWYPRSDRIFRIGHSESCQTNLDILGAYQLLRE
jgi:hypothetical protein